MNSGIRKMYEIGQCFFMPQLMKMNSFSFEKIPYEDTNQNYSYNCYYSKLNDNIVIQCFQIISTKINNYHFPIITLPVPMKNNDYIGIASVSSKNNSYTKNHAMSIHSLSNKTTTSFVVELDNRTGYEGCIGTSVIIIGEYATD